MFITDSKLRYLSAFYSPPTYTLNVLIKSNQLFMLQDMLSSALGKPKHNEYNWVKNSFNCPKCTEMNGNRPDGKYNLDVNLNKKYKGRNLQIFKCWKCDSYSGTVWKIIKEYGTQHDCKMYKELQLDSVFYGNTDTVEKKFYLKLPKEYISFKEVFSSEENFQNIDYTEAYDYLIEERKLTHDIILKYDLGFCNEGYYKDRIIIPSYDRYHKLNYFDSRAFKKYNSDGIKLIPYQKPNGVEKSLIIFNESNINWNIPVFLLEGVFDMLSLPVNSIPLLGKELSDHLYNTLIKYKPTVVVMLDDDAQNKALDICESLKIMGLKNIYNVKNGNKDMNEILKNDGISGVLNNIKNNLKKYE